MSFGSTLSPELAEQARYIEGLAVEAGLDFYPVVFEMLDAKDVNAVASFGGFPVRYPSWRFGMEYERLEKGRIYGLSKIYELVINNDPVYAYLVRANSTMEQKLVMAHVYGHADFFKHNIWFGPTERHMLDVMANHGTRLRRYIDAFGQDEVERFLDVALCLDTLIDPYLPLRTHLHDRPQTASKDSQIERARRSFDAIAAPPLANGPGAGSSDDPAFLQKTLGLPTYDILGFLAEHAPLDAWKRGVMRIVRSEAYYFMPQRMTKIMNEGWASFWHSRLLTGGILGNSEIIDFADCHSGATQAAPGQLNPYKLGIELFRHAEEQGMDLFRLRRVHNDVSFIDEIVDEEFAQRNQLFVYGRNVRTGRTEVLNREWEQVKASLLQELTWGGMPQIELTDDDHEGRGELLMRHHHDGRDLQLDQAAQTLLQVTSLWQRPVHLDTQEEGQGKRLTASGTEITVTDISLPGAPPAADLQPEGSKEAS